jgi:hypothetical protein
LGIVPEGRAGSASAECLLTARLKQFSRSGVRGELFRNRARRPSAERVGGVPADRPAQTVLAEWGQGVSYLGIVPEGRARSASAECLLTARLKQFSRSENW